MVILSLLRNLKFELFHVGNFWTLLMRPLQYLTKNVCYPLILPLSPRPIYLTGRGLCYMRLASSAALGFCLLMWHHPLSEPKPQPH